MPKRTLTITDNRTGKTYEVDIKDDTIRALDLRQIKVAEDDFGMMGYDPAFTNTASCRSQVTFIDGGKGILWYRGYPIEQLAEKSTFLETAYLLIFGELPDRKQLGVVAVSGEHAAGGDPTEIADSRAAIAAHKSGGALTCRVRWRFLAEYQPFVSASQTRRLDCATHIDRRRSV